MEKKPEGRCTGKPSRVTSKIFNISESGMRIAEIPIGRVWKKRKKWNRKLNNGKVMTFGNYVDARDHIDNTKRIRGVK